MAADMVRIVAGLGNPGERYQFTRHNVGFMVANRLVERLECEGAQAKFGGLVHDCWDGSKRVQILKPLTYMNLSGRSVLAAKSWFKTECENILIIYDELDLPFGEIRLRQKGSPAGHNGLTSVIEHLGTQEVPRLRVGIGRPSRGSATSYVLSRFRVEEEAELPLVLDHAADAVICWIEHGIHEAMGRYNGINVLARDT